MDRGWKISPRWEENTGEISEKVDRMLHVVQMVKNDEMQVAFGNGEKIMFGPCMEWAPEDLSEDFYRPRRARPGTWEFANCN